MVKKVEFYIEADIGKWDLRDLLVNKAITEHIKEHSPEIYEEYGLEEEDQKIDKRLKEEFSVEQKKRAWKKLLQEIR